MRHGRRFRRGIYMKTGGIVSGLRLSFRNVCLSRIMIIRIHLISGQKRALHDVGGNENEFCGLAYAGASAGGVGILWGREIANYLNWSHVTADPDSELCHYR